MQPCSDAGVWRAVLRRGNLADCALVQESGGLCSGKGDWQIVFRWGSPVSRGLDLDRERMGHTDEETSGGIYSGEGIVFFGGQDFSCGVGRGGFGLPFGGFDSYAERMGFGASGGACEPSAPAGGGRSG